MIDIHCHLLPNVDDGPSSLPDSLAMARRQIEEGVHTVVYSPHVDWTWNNDPATIAAAAGRAVPFIRERLPTLNIVSGAEIALTKAADLGPDAIAAMSLGAGDWALIEAPHAGDLDIPRLIAQVRAKKRRVVLAHPERSPAAMRQVSEIERMAASGILLCQLTAGSFSGAFGRGPQTASQSLLKRGLVHVIASDAHDLDRRPPGLAPAAPFVGEDLFRWATSEVPAAVLEGTHIPLRPAARSRGIGRRWLPRLSGG